MSNDKIGSFIDILVHSTFDGVEMDIYAMDI